ncbi:MAG: STAS domain-containing protein [Acidobacteria bacterium]|nr:STAS domain-containing protein [Acidobacteriota bacterium]MBI1984063.1 STAS domain-containing protein [Acidobacteriota bacterium]
MKVEVRNADNISIIDCAGDVDLYSSTRLRETLLNEMRSGKANVLVNMAEVSYIDSSGIATLVEGLQLSRETKTRFGLYGLRRNARSVLELARLHTVFVIFDNEKEALEKIAATEPFGGL